MCEIFRTPLFVFIQYILFRFRTLKCLFFTKDVQKGLYIRAFVIIFVQNFAKKTEMSNFAQSLTAIRFYKPNGECLIKNFL